MTDSSDINNSMETISLPRISIVTPSFNQGEYLEECIDSVLSQNYPNLEYVIMDGGSTDNSVEIIKKYEKYLTYWQSRPDGGQYPAINEGFRKTTGKIMAWLNSDDKYHHHAFYKAALLFSNNEHLAWLTGRPAFWNKHGECSYILCELLPAYSREKFLRKVYKDPWIQQESTFWRKELWEKAGGEIRSGLEYAGDIDLWVRFFRHAQLHTVDTLLGGYRNHGEQKAVLFMDRYIQEAEKILDEEIELFEAGKNRDLLPEPDPITLAYGELRRYVDKAYSQVGAVPYTICADADLAMGYLVRRVKESETDRAEQIWIADDLQKKTDDLQRKADELQNKADDLKVKLEKTDQSLAEVNAELGAVYASWSWKLTAPMRRVLGILQRLFKK